MTAPSRRSSAVAAALASLGVAGLVLAAGSGSDSSGTVHAAVAEPLIAAGRTPLQPVGSAPSPTPSAPPEATSVPVSDPAGAVAVVAPVEATAVRAPAPERVPGREGEPVWLLVPDAGVSAPVRPVGIEPGGSLGVPDDPDVVGWWAEGALLAGVPQVLVGHVDSRSGPGVFASLDRLAVGEPVLVVDGDGSRTAYEVRALRRVPKTEFPTADVYGARERPTLQLITCTGSFDRATGHYRDNLIVTATVAGRDPL